MREKSRAYLFSKNENKSTSSVRVTILSSCGVHGQHHTPRTFFACALQTREPDSTDTQEGSCLPKPRA